jgi:chromate reductase, NAD(P)H dehydrogenase (quinone)
MTTILGISGSLRSGSFNTALLTAAQKESIPGVEIEAASIRGIPIYDGDVEAEGIPHEVAALKERVVQADGLLLVTPEYNNSVPGPLKNAIDWLSRPPSDVPRIFRALPVAIIGASPGAFGTAHAQSAWLPVLRTLRTQPWFGGRLMVPRAKDVFNDTGELVDDEVRERLRDFLQGFARFIDAGGRSGRGEPG